MKIAFCGKGGVGKTTLAALACWALVDKEKKVLAIDADPCPNLALTLGFSQPEIIAVAERKELIAERMEIKGEDRSFYKLNPKIDDLPDKLVSRQGNLGLLVMGTIKKGGAGCACPESTFLKNLLRHLLLEKNEAVVMDMEAGLEHLGRATAESVDRLIIVVEPDIKNIEIKDRIVKLARDIGIKNLSLLANKIKNEADLEFVGKKFLDIEIIGEISYNKRLEELSRSGDFSSLKKDEIYQEMKRVVERCLLS
jgi:CO dehydrogenase maturation factor